ncbi:MAG: hypothetical protein OHK0019_16470 [Saprospiraceae bacterium]
MGEGLKLGEGIFGIGEQDPHERKLQGELVGQCRVTNKLTFEDLLFFGTQATV